MLADAGELLDPQRRKGAGGKAVCKGFISHAWSEGGHKFAIRLAKALRANGLDVWLDEQQILPAQHVKQRMRTGVIHECDAFLFVLSPGSLESEACAIELKEALKRRDESGLQIIPILFKDCEIPSELKELRYVDFRDQARFDEYLEQLLPGIRAASRVRALVAVLIDGDPDSRAEAAQHLAKLRNRFVVPILARRLHVDSDPDPTVRFWLAYALGQIGGEEACAALRAAHEKETNPHTRLGIEDALKEQCPPDP